MLCQQANVEQLMEPVAGLEVTRRIRGDGRKVYFILNHNDSPQHVTLPPGTYTSLLDGSEQHGDGVIAERDVLILLEK